MANSTSENLDDKSTEQIIDGFHCKMQALVTLAQTQLSHAKENQDRDVLALQSKLNNSMSYCQILWIRAG